MSPRAEVELSVELLRLDDPCRSFWYRGLTCDHLYPDCPNMRRAETALRKAGWWDAAMTDADHLARLGPYVDPHGAEVCGLCAHRHNQTAHPARPVCVAQKVSA